MFRSKIFPVLQSIVNKNLYNIEYAKTVQCLSFSTTTSKETSNVTSSENNNKVPQQPQDSSEISINATIGTSTVNTSGSDEYEPDKLYKKLEIEVRGNDPAVLKSYGEFAVMAANHLNISVTRNFAPKKGIHERYTVLKSVHVHKKHRVQYETRTYYRYLDIFKVTGSTADTFLEYIQRNLPEGVAMKVTKVELQTLPESVKQAAVLQ